MQKARLTPEDLLEVPLEGPIPEGASVESVVHREVYRRTGARALVHAHPRVAVALSFHLSRLRPLDLEGQHYLKEVPVLAPKTVSATEEAALSVAEALREHRACLLRGHGAFAVGLKEAPEEAPPRGLRPHDHPGGERPDPPLPPPLAGGGARLGGGE